MTVNHSGSGLNPNFDFKAHLQETMDHVTAGEISKLDPDPRALDASSRISAPESIAIGELNERNLVPVAVAAANRAFEYQNTDEKTGLKKGEFFKAQLGATITELGDEDDLAVTIFDVDNFKSVNDVLGHAKGDELLGIVGEAYKEIYKRDSDTLAHGSRDDQDSTARLHGDEFGAIITHDKATTGQDRTNSAQHEAVSQAERLNLLIQQKLKDTIFERFGVKLSQGTASYEKGDTPETLIFKADIAMLTNKYKDKEAELSTEDKAWLGDSYNSQMIYRLGLRVPDWLATHITINDEAQVE